MTAAWPRAIVRVSQKESISEDVMEDTTTTMTTTTIEVDDGTDEDLRVHAWRAEQLERLGIPAWLADIVADRIDWHELAALVARGCSPRLALDIVR
jgi:hypothetical protein